MFRKFGKFAMNLKNWPINSGEFSKLLIIFLENMEIKFYRNIYYLVFPDGY